MTPQSEFISETFHTLAQPIAALRVTVELGLREDAGKPARQVLEDCLRLTDHLMQDMALLREIASLAEAPQLESCDGEALLQASVEEMAPVAEASVSLCSSTRSLLSFSAMRRCWSGRYSF